MKRIFQTMPLLVAAFGAAIGCYSPPPRQPYVPAPTTTTRTIPGPASGYAAPGQASGSYQSAPAGRASPGAPSTTRAAPMPSGTASPPATSSGAAPAARPAPTP